MKDKFSQPKTKIICFPCTVHGERVFGGLKSGAGIDVAEFGVVEEKRRGHVRPPEQHRRSFRVRNGRRLLNGGPTLYDVMQQRRRGESPS